MCGLLIRRENDREPKADSGGLAQKWISKPKLARLVNNNPGNGIVDMAYGNGRWMLVMHQGNRRIGTQVVPLNVTD